MEPSIEVGSNLVYFCRASINLARNCAVFSSSLWIISQSLSKLTDLCPGFWRSTMCQTTVWLWAAHQVSLPDNPSWDLLRNSCGPMDLVLSVHQHAPESLATLVPSLLGEEWRKAWCKYHTRLSLKNGFSSVQFSHSVVSDSLRPRESQHARPPCPSPTPRVYSNSCPFSRWCHPAISSSVVPFSSCPQSFPASESFPMSQLFTWGAQSIGVSASASIGCSNEHPRPISFRMDRLDLLAVQGTKTR